MNQGEFERSMKDPEVLHGTLSDAKALLDQARVTKDLDVVMLAVEAVLDVVHVMLHGGQMAGEW